MFILFLEIQTPKNKVRLVKIKLYSLCAKRLQREDRGVSLIKLDPAVRREKVIGATLRPLCCQGRDPVVFVYGAE